jgi:hypothetical protein
VKSQGLKGVVVSGCPPISSESDAVNLCQVSLQLRLKSFSDVVVKQGTFRPTKRGGILHLDSRVGKRHESESPNKDILSTIPVEEGRFIIFPQIY